MEFLIMVLLVALLVISVLVKRRPYNPRKEGIKQLRRTIRGSPDAAKTPMLRAMLAADDAVPRIRGFVTRTLESGLANETPGIVFLETCCAYTFFIGTNAIREYPTEYEQYMATFAGGLVDYAQHDLHWPESSLQTFSERLQQSTIAYGRIASSFGTDGIARQFASSISGYDSPATENHIALTVLKKILNDMAEDAQQLFHSR